MRKASMTRKRPAGAKGTCWTRSPGYANKEDVRDGTRNELVNALPELMQVLLEKARKGSVTHIKLLMQLERDLAHPEPEEQRGKNLEEILMEQWAKDAANKNAARRSGG